MLAPTRPPRPGGPGANRDRGVTPRLASQSRLSHQSPVRRGRDPQVARVGSRAHRLLRDRHHRPGDEGREADREEYRAGPSCVGPIIVAPSSRHDRRAPECLTVPNAGTQALELSMPTSSMCPCGDAPDPVKNALALWARASRDETVVRPRTGIGKKREYYLARRGARLYLPCCPMERHGTPIRSIMTKEISEARVPSVQNGVRCV